MELTWLGRYRGIVAALVHHSNSVNRALTERRDYGGGVSISTQEFQILEALIEHEDKNYIMADLAARLAIPQSTMTKAAQQLTACGLVERYRLADNKKSVILKPSEKGRALYNNYCEAEARQLFADFFAKLDTLTDEQLDTVTDAIMTLDKTLSQDSDKQLIKIED